MAVAHRILPEAPYRSLKDYVAAGGGRGLAAARAVDASIVVDELAASGLRGRGGAGYPTASKWRTIASFASPVLATAVVVNAAEGEPGTFKDRTILRDNPYAVIEGALIAARVVGARSITVATKQRFHRVIARVEDAIREIVAAGWADGTDIEVVGGPAEYLFGEETGLLEVLDGRPPFPRIAPPWRRGVVEIVEDSEATAISGGASGGVSGLSADLVLGSSDGATAAPPVLVNNVETMANVPGIIADGAAWFREMGTAESPGTVVCTVSGARRRGVVVEVELGTPLREILDLAETDTDGGRPIVAVLAGVSSAILTPDRLDTPISYEALTAAGSGLGSAGFVIVDDNTEPIALAAGVSRFLAVESCGQCTPCKQDGLEVLRLLEGIRDGVGREDDLTTIAADLDHITDGARCFLATQQQVVIGSILAAFDTEIRARTRDAVDPVEPMLVAELIEIGPDGGITLDDAFAGKQPDWTIGGTDSGQSPVDRLTDHRA